MVFAHHYYGREDQPPPQKGGITKIIIANKRGGGERAKEKPLEVKVNIIVTQPKSSSPHPLPTPFSGDK